MKKLFSFLVPMMALFLTPQKAKADYVDDNLIKPLTIEKTATGVAANVKFYYNETTGSKSTTSPVNIEYRYSKNGGAWSSWIKLSVANSTKTSKVCSTTSDASITPTDDTGMPLSGFLGNNGWKMQFRGKNSNGFNSSSAYFQLSIESGASPRPTIYVSGNIMSLIEGYDTDDTDASVEVASQNKLKAANTIPNDYCFYRLFHKHSAISNLVNWDCSNLIFPATKLTNHCYDGLFEGLANNSYGLNQAPTFLATGSLNANNEPVFTDKDGNSVESAFRYLCYNCSKLTNIHVNFQYCYGASESNLTSWLYNCGSSKTLYAPSAFIECENNNTGLSTGVWATWASKKTEWSKEVGPSTHTVTLTVDGTNSYGTLDEDKIDDVEDQATIAIDGNKLTIGSTVVTATPTTSDGDYTYTFSAWKNGSTVLTGSSNKVTEDMTITAHFTRANTKYTLTWDMNGGTTATAENAYTHGDVEWGAGITAPENLTKDFHTFAGWNTTPESTMPKSNTTYTAQWTLANPIMLNDNGDAAYYAAYDALDGTTNANVRLNRSTISANTWSTICLPFDVDIEDNNSGYEGKFYKFMGATGDYTGIDLHFSPAGSVDANTPYLFRSNADVTAPEFANVTLKAREVINEGTIGNVTFRGTIAPQTLYDKGVHTILGLYENHIYYPNTTSGTYIRAFRGYFIVDGMAGVQPRVRIVVQDNNATPIEVIELGGGETKTEVRKYVEDGVMVIEKNGVRYSVTGQEMK